MKHIAALFLALALQDAPAPRWTASEGLQNPESAYYDADAGCLFVSNVAGTPVEKDGKGWISKLDLDGKVLTAQWVSGFHAPKGLRAHQGTLWVSDIDQIASIDIAAGKVKDRIAVAEAKFLNDVAIDGDGTVYVSDMFTSRIHRVKGGKAEVFAQGDELEHPNGLLVEGDRLIVAAWGKPEADFSTKVPGRLYALDLKSAKKTLITPEPVGNLDGLESDGKGGYVVTDWMSGKVYHIAGGKVRVLMALSQGTADPAYLPGKKLLVLPQMAESKVMGYDLSKLLD